MIFGSIPDLRIFHLENFGAAVLVFLRVHPCPLIRVHSRFFCALCALLRLFCLTLRFYVFERSNERDSGKPESRRTCFRRLIQ